MKNRQQGSALIFSLVILLVMTLIGITAMSSSTLEETMATNDRSQKVAFQNAESALRIAETDIADRDYLGDLETDFTSEPPTAGFYDASDNNAANDMTLNVFDASAWSAGTNCVATAGEQCYTVEQIEFNAPVSHIDGATYNLITRITVKGNDNSGTANVILQAYNNKDLTE